MPFPPGPLIAITGPTASGKTEWAERLAQDFDGELISADSRSLYRELDILTAKPRGRSLPDGRFQADSGAIYHLIDIANPTQAITLADFQRLALAAWRDILSRGRLPILVGGTGLYVEAVIANYQLPPAQPDPTLRAELEQLPLETLRSRLRSLSPALPTAHSSLRNKRRLIRAIELATAETPPADRQPIPPEILLLAPDRSSEELHTRIASRVDEMIASGLVDELRQVSVKYPSDLPALSSVAYPIFLRYLNEEITLEKAKTEFATKDWQLARRQLTWWRRVPEVQWVKDYPTAKRLLAAHLRKFPL